MKRFPRAEIIVCLAVLVLLIPGLASGTPPKPLITSGAPPQTAALIESEEGIDPNHLATLPAVPKNVALISHLDGTFNEIQVENNLVFAAAGQDGLQIIDLSDPLSPAVIGSFQTQSHLYRVDVVDQTAYVIDGEVLRILDISNPALPTEIGFFEVEPPDNCDSQIDEVHVADDIAYLSVTIWVPIPKGWEATFYLYILDVSNPINPVVLSSLPVLNYLAEMTIRDGIAFLSVGQLSVLDVSDPFDPAEIGSLFWGWSPLALALDGEILYVSIGSRGLFSIDVSDPAHPVQIGSYETKLPELSPYDELPFLNDIEIQGDLAFVSDWYFGLRVFYIQDPAHPGEVGYYQTQGNSSGVELLGDLILLSREWQGLDIFQYTGPEEFFQASGQVTNMAGRPIPHAIVSDEEGHYAFTGADGTYTLNGLEAGSHTLAPAEMGYAFSPPERTITVPPDVTGQDFIGERNWVFLPFAGGR